MRFRQPSRLVGTSRQNGFIRVADHSPKAHEPNRHTLVTELSEAGAGDEVIMGIAGHVSRAMLARYSHVRMEAKRRALEEIAARQKAADEKRKKEGEKRKHAARADSPCAAETGGQAATAC